MQNTTHMDKCMHSFNVNMHDANAIVKNLIPNISNKGQIPLIPKRLQETNSQNRTYDLDI